MKVRRAADRDEGFGVVEIIVSMMLLALLLVSLAPVLIQSLRVSARTATMAYATQVVNERVQLARAASTSCADFEAFINVPAPTVFDARGVEIVVVQDPAPGSTIICPGQGVQLFGVQASSAITGELLAEAKNAIAVPGW